jgi:hypothetical protein
VNSPPAHSAAPAVVERSEREHSIVQPDASATSSLRSSARSNSPRFSAIVNAPPAYNAAPVPSSGTRVEVHSAAGDKLERSLRDVRRGNATGGEETSA